MNVEKPVPATREPAGSVADVLNVRLIRPLIPPVILPLTVMFGDWAVIGIDCVGEIWYELLLPDTMNVPGIIPLADRVDPLTSAVFELNVSVVPEIVPVTVADIVYLSAGAQRSMVPMYGHATFIPYAENPLAAPVNT